MFCQNAAFLQSMKVSKQAIQFKMFCQNAVFLQSMKVSKQAIQFKMFCQNAFFLAINEGGQASHSVQDVLFRMQFSCNQ